VIEIAEDAEQPMFGRSASKTYGTVSSERQKAMSGLAFVQGLADGSLPLNTIARTLGYDIAEAASGRVVVAAVPTDALLNPAGTVHGGFAATLLDSAMGLAIQSTLEPGVSQTTLEFKICSPGRSCRTPVRSRPRASFSAAAAVSALPKAGSPIVTGGSWPTARRRA
jgi:acyl-coenzyme A thioesterase PaaI-like protein